MSLRRFAILVGAALLAAGAPAAHADPSYSLDLLPSGFAAEELNNLGHIVGTTEGAAAILAGGTLTSLASVAPVSFGLGINNRGDVAGSLDERYVGSAFSYIAGTVTNLQPLLPDNFFYSYASAINDKGAVGGNAAPFIGERVRGFIYRDGVFSFIGTFGGEFSQFEALNDKGAAAGYASFAGPALAEPTHAFYFHHGALRDLGTLGGENSQGLDLNNAGDVVGWSEGEDFGRHPFLYRDGDMVDLGTLGGGSAEARAINGLGAIVGSSLLLGDAVRHAFLYLDGALVDLNDRIDPASGWELTAAYDINDAGQILGTACQAGACTAVLLSPVPEPTAGALLLAGLAVLGLRRRRGMPGAAPRFA